MTPWRYWRPRSRRENLVEFSSVRGIDVGLPAHFHDQDQVTFVIAGRRRFRFGAVLLELGPGEGLVIPAGTPHASLHEPHGAHCLNAYVAPGSAADEELIGELAWRHEPDRAAGDAEPPGFVLHRSAAPPSKRPPAAPGLRTDERVARAATRAGLSRESFSRRFRRDHGMPPHAFQVMARLNNARDMLRLGLPIAAVAADTGFADQSHLGRCFRRFFGVTPGAYRAGARVTNVPDESASPR